MKNRNDAMFGFALTMLLAGLISSPAWAAPAGRIVAWGSGEVGQTNVPPGDDFVAISSECNAGHALALRSDGSLAGWGYNKGDPGLGQGDTFFGQAIVPTGNDFKAIATGAFHSLALKSDGTVLGWGSNIEGNGIDVGQARVPDGLSNVVAIAAGDWHSLALKSDGSLLAWGDNSTGQTDVPAGNDFVAIATGDFHNLALKSDGSIVGWGDGDFGQINVPPDTNFVVISAGLKYSLALKSDGSMAGWGHRGISGGAQIPRTGTNFVAISAGYVQSLALKSDGSMVGWGANTGDNGVFYGQAVPRPGTNFTAIAAGSFFSLAIQVQPPILTIGQIGNDVLVSWSTNHIGYTLETTTDLSSPRTWSKVPGAPTTLSNQFVLTNSVTGGRQFFRLER